MTHEGLDELCVKKPRGRSGLKRGDRLLLIPLLLHRSVGLLVGCRQLCVKNSSKGSLNSSENTPHHTNHFQKKKKLFPSSFEDNFIFALNFFFSLFS